MRLFLFPSRSHPRSWNKLSLLRRKSKADWRVACSQANASYLSVQKSKPINDTRSTAVELIGGCNDAKQQDTFSRPGYATHGVGRRTGFSIPYCPEDGRLY